MFFLVLLLLAKSKPKRSLPIDLGSSSLQARCGLALMFLVGTSSGIAETAAERYTGMMTLPIDLFTPEGTKIEKRKYETEVGFDGTHWTLSFLLDGKDRVLVQGDTSIGDPFALGAVIPLVGTHYMRSSSQPLRTAQERQFSKTGLPQYAEEERDWKATLRVYRNANKPGDVFFIFQVRKAGGQLTRTGFRLHERN